MNNILKSLVVVEILLTRNPEFTENSTNLLIKSHLYPASHSFYLKPDSISSEEDENMHYKNCSDILNKFKAYSEMIKSSTSRSLRESMTNEKDQDDKKSSSLYRYFEFKELKIVEITENDENQQITFKISYRYCDKLYETDRTIAEFKTLIKDINEFYDGLNFSYDYLEQQNINENLEKMKTFIESFLNLIIEKQLITTFFKNFLKPNDQVKYYGKKQNNIVSSPTTHITIPLFRSPRQNKKEDILGFNERSSSFTTNRDKMRNIKKKADSDENMENLSTKIEIKSSFIQEKFDNKRETIYEINVLNQENNASTIIFKSYKDFMKLQKKLEIELNGNALELPLLPPKKDDLMRKTLQNYTQSLVSNTFIKSSKTMNEFFELKNII